MANNTNKNNKNKKTFFKDFKAELKKVTWPTFKQVVHNTVSVIIMVIIVAVIVFILDFAFESINKYGVNGLKGVLESTQAETDNKIAEIENELANEIATTTAETTTGETSLENKTTTQE